MSDCLGLTSKMLSINQLKLDLPYKKVVEESIDTNGHVESGNEEEIDRTEDERRDQVFKSKKKAKKNSKSECLDRRVL